MTGATPVRPAPDGHVGRVGVVLVAAGSGVRLGSDGPKALVEVAGRPLVAHALAGLASAELPAAIVVHPPEHRAAFARAAGDLPVAAFVAGGTTRTASVRAGVGALGEDVEVVVVHDAARCLTPPAVIRGALAVVADDRAAGGADPGLGPVLAAAPALPVADTLKRTVVDPSSGTREVVGTVDRTGLVGVQTPQVFRHEALAAALASGRDATDELSLVEALVDAGELQGRVVVVPGSLWALKVTYPADLATAEALAAAPPGAHPHEVPA